MTKKYLLITLLLLSFSNVFSYDYPKWNFRFPLDIEAKVSGSYGEIRSNHFHSGVDLTTLGKTGLPVYAIDDGYVSRIGVSPVGFGKAIYIDHPNGYTSVYAHLESFSQKIEQVALKIQYEKESFQINEYFKPNEIVVSKGEIIALSGNSGSSGGPHLHFEIRETVEQKPLNVHRFGLPIKDDKPPHIESVTIYPLDENSYINGKNEKVNIATVFHSNRFNLKGNPTIKAVGNIGIGIETVDYYPDSWRKCGVYSIELKNNDKPVFYSKLDGFLFSDTRYINSHIDYSQKMTNSRVVQKSFLDENNNLDIYISDKNNGVVNILPFSDNNFEYVVKDADDNKSLLSFKIVGDSQSYPTKVIDNNEYTVYPKEKFSYSKNGFEINFFPNTFYQKVMFDKDNFLSGNGLNTKITILNNKIPFHIPFELKMPIPNGVKSDKLTGAYINNNGRMNYVGGEIVGNSLIVRPREGGVYTFAVDTIAPIVQLKAVPKDSNYSNSQSIKVSVYDEFSGVESYYCTIDDKWVLFEYDPKNKEMIGFFKYMNLQKGKKHNLKVVVKDNLGNSTTMNKTFFY